MYILKKHLLTVLCLTMGLIFLSSFANAQALKIGFVKDDIIKQEYKAWQRAQEQWDLESKTWDEEALAKQDELQELIDEYEKQKLILSEDKKNEKEVVIRTKQDALDAYTRQIYGPGGTAERKQTQLIQPLLEKVTKAIESVAIEEEFDVVFTLQSGLGYIKENYDITDKVLKYLEAQEE